MTPPDWDQLFSADDYVYGTEPTEFLVSQAHLLRPGMLGLAVADGEGRNGVWMAGQGVTMLSVDSSAVGLEKARKLAAEKSVRIGTLCVDLLDWDWPKTAFDVVAAFYIHFPSTQRPKMHQAMLAALKPGGHLIMEVFHPDQLRYGTGGPPDADMLYSAATLKADFQAARIDLLEEVERTLSAGRMHRDKGKVTRMVATRI